MKSFQSLAQITLSSSMILASDTDPAFALSAFSSLGLSAAFLVPTATAMKKSIIDATHPVRNYLVANDVHDYAVQAQGQDAKSLKRTFFVYPDRLIETKTSMYRPPTKEGDPRIWFYDLKSYARAYNLLAVIAHGGIIYVINCSVQEIIKSLDSGNNPLFAAINISETGLSNEALELLEMLKIVGQKGWIKSLREGDTGVGFTLETLLGIPANSKKAPDFKGVEIKSSRSTSSNQSLFGKTPNWKESRLKSSFKILSERGRFSAKKNRYQLFHSIFAPKPNSYGLQLEVDFESDLLIQYCNVIGGRVDDVLWELETLKTALRNKHRQTFWVNSKSNKTADFEEFLYFEGTYTRGPNIDAFPLLLEAGDVFVDYTIKQTPTGGAKDQGYLFRMKKNRLHLLFGKPRIFKIAKSPQ
jgi:MvaI/BcnI restriction endonuclease family protein